MGSPDSISNCAPTHALRQLAVGLVLALRRVPRGHRTAQSSRAMPSENYRTPVTHFFRSGSSCSGTSGGIVRDLNFSTTRRPMHGPGWDHDANNLFEHSYAEPLRVARPLLDEPRRLVPLVVGQANDRVASVRRPTCRSTPRR